MSDIKTISQHDLQLIDGLKLLLQAETDGQRSLQWIQTHKDAINRLLQTNGALLIRGLNVPSSNQFGQLLMSLFGESLIRYEYRSTPRTELRGNIYTATEYHADQTIPQHSENAYANSWAMRIGFLCTQPALSGGATPIADNRIIYQQIPAEIREEFVRKGVMYVRNYANIDLPWQEVFQTQDRDQVAQYCAQNRIDCQWSDDDTLRTVQINPAVQIHPVTGDYLWFNQAHLYHLSNLSPEMQQSLLSLMPVDKLPKNTFFGDGSAIDPAYLAIIRQLYIDHKVAFPWQKHDLLLLDNMLFTHGREPYSGERQVLVGMTTPYGC